MKRHLLVVLAVLGMAGILALLASDPAQPSVGGKQVVVATNGYAGTLTVRTQFNAGLANSVQLVPDIADGQTPFRFDTGVAHTSGELVEFKNGGADVFSFQVGNFPEMYVASSGIDYGDYGSFGMDIYVAGNQVLQLFPYLGDGHTPYIFDTKEAFTSGNLAEWKNNGTSALTLSAFAELATHGDSSSMTVFNTAAGPTFYADVGSIKQFMGGATAIMDFSPGTLDGATAYKMDTTLSHSSGDLADFANNGTNQVAIKWNGAIQTSIPTGATNAQPFRVGDKANGSGLTLVTTNYIQLEVNGVLYKLALVQ